MLTRQLTSNIRWLKYQRCSTNAQEPGKVRAKMDQYRDAYEDFTGVKSVRESQEEVMKWSRKLSDAQSIRREKQAEISDIQSRLKEIHFDLDRTSRGEDKYLQLITEEHKIIKKERELISVYHGLETAEREAFYQFSTRIRESHEREREYSEKTKWWGVSASLIGALLGIAGTSVGNELRMRKLKEMIPIGGATMSEMAKAIGDQNEKVAVFLADMRTALQLEGSDIKKVFPESDVKKVSDLDKLLAAIREENARLSQEMRELSRLAKLEAVLDADPTAVVYVGSDMERLLEQTEKNIESKMKLRTLLTVVVIYTAVAVTAPWLYAVFRGD